MRDNSNKLNNCEFSIIIPVLHEAEIINALIEQLYSQQLDECYEIIVVDGDPNQETINAIQHKDVIALVSAAGRGRQMNAGAAIARGEILIFLHADTYLPVNALSLIRHTLENKLYVGGAFDLGIRSDRLILKIIANAACIRSRLTRIPYGDQALFVRKDYFNEIGGYLSIPLMEDVEIIQRIKKRGDKIYLLSERVLTSARRWEKEGVVYCTLRNWVLISLYFLGVSPERLTKLYKNSYSI